VQFALRVDVDTRNDTAINRWARAHDYILVCHDKHKRRETRMDLYPDIYENGGKILRVGGEPSQDPLVVVGRVLVHLEEWRSSFEENDGIVVLRKDGINTLPAHELYQKVQHLLDTDQLAGRKLIKPSRERPKRPRMAPSAQLRLDI